MVPLSKSAKGAQAEAGSGMFLRKATGLVREVSVWDAIVLNSSGMNVGVGVALLFLWGAQMPGASILWATIICTVFVAVTTAYNYAAAAGAFPRSGADYVFTSRVLGPVWGFMLSGQQVIWNFFWMAFNAWAMANFALPGTLQLIGEFTNNQGLIDLAGKVTNVWVVVTIAVILQILFSLLHISGLKNYFTYMKITFAICALSVVVSIFVLLFGGQNFQANWNAIMAAKGGLSYQGVIDAAKAAGFDPNAPFSFTRTLALMPMVFWIVGFFNGSPQIGGEVKKSRSTQFTSMVTATLVNGGVVALLAILVSRFIGNTFLNSLGYLYFNNAAILKLGVNPDFNFLVNVVARSVPVAGLLGIAYVLWATNGTPNIIAFVTRSILAYSFDRMAPESMGAVSEKTHTPVRAIIFTAVMGLVAIVVILVWQSASLLSSMMAQLFAYLVLSVAAIIFPYKLPKLWKTQTSARKLFGLPLLTITGVISVLFIALMSYYFGFYPIFGANTPLSLIAVGVTIVISALYYYIYRAYQKSHGVDVDLAFKEIPPE
ncbi:MAG: APC family permease [Anaerolineaceae bacterium]|nr:APC family permease [Anaerolineaceae bacterium]